MLGRIRELRGGGLNDSDFGTRMRGEGRIADGISQMFKIARRKVGLDREGMDLSTAAFRRVSPGQMELF